MEKFKKKNQNSYHKSTGSELGHQKVVYEKPASFQKTITYPHESDDLSLGKPKYLDKNLSAYYEKNISDRFNEVWPGDDYDYDDYSEQG